jgi:hypothetical protein
MRVGPVLMCSFMLWTGVSQLHVNSKPAPSSIEELARDTDVIAIGTIEEVRDIQRSAGPPGVTSGWMECRLNISELLKQDMHVSPVTTVLTFYVMGSHNSYEIGFRPFQKGEELLVLSKDGVRGRWIRAYIWPRVCLQNYEWHSAAIRPIGCCEAT